MSPIKQYKNLIYLTQRRGLFIGHVAPSMRSAQASPVLLVNLLGQFHVDVKGSEIISKTILLRAGMEIEFSSRDLLIADFMLDRIEGDYERIQAQMQISSHGVYFGLRDVEHVTDILFDIYEKEHELRDAMHLMTNYFDRTAPLTQARKVDLRVAEVVDVICKSPFEKQPLEEFAKHVNLSAPRLVELFKQEMGVPIRKYRIWRRFFSACQSIATQSNITEAAHKAGFTDSSHFCKHFKDMFGVNPKAIFRPETRIVIKSK